MYFGSVTADLLQMRRVMGSKSSSSAPPPDPRLIEAQIRSLGVQDDVIKQIMANANEMLPLQKEQTQFALDTARQAVTDSQADRSWMLTRRNLLSNAQDQLVSDATGFNAKQRTDQFAAEAGADAQSAIELRGERIENLTPAQMVDRGVIQVMEGRHCFAHLSIEDNLLTGAYTRKDGKAAIAQTLEKVYNYFPRLKTRRSSQAAYTSGGEQQMCAIGRALMANPRMVLLDEPSMGLAPQIVEEVFEIVKDLNTKEKVTFLLAEQNTNMALRYADYGYILESGRVVNDGEAKALAENEDVKEFYLGVSGEGRKNFKDAKFYRRRKRWLS